jgi:hypothetical protein
LKPSWARRLAIHVEQAMDVGRMLNASTTPIVILGLVPRIHVFLVV